MEGEHKHLSITHRIERKMTERCPKGNEEMTKLDKPEVCDEEARNGFSWGVGGEGSNLLSVAMINVMPKAVQRGKGFI